MKNKSNDDKKMVEPLLDPNLMLCAFPAGLNLFKLKFHKSLFFIVMMIGKTMHEKSARYNLQIRNIEQFSDWIGNVYLNIYKFE